MHPGGVFQKLRPGDISELTGLFDNARASAFRLEILEQYSVPEELDELKQYRAGRKKPPPGSNQEWVDLIRKRTTDGVLFQRVRLYRRPISEYLKYEIAWGYSLNVPAGENISCIEFDDLLTLAGAVPIFKDFWMFDDSVAYLLDYDAAGRFLGVYRVPDEDLPPYTRLKRELLNKSEPIQGTELWRFAM